MSRLPVYANGMTANHAAAANNVVARSTGYRTGTEKTGRRDAIATAAVTAHGAQ